MKSHHLLAGLLVVLSLAHDGAAIPLLPVPHYTIALSGQHAPGTSGDTNYSSFNTPMINEAGHVAFAAQLAGSDVGDNLIGIWRGDAGSLDLVARRGFQAPGTAPNTKFGDFITVDFNDRDDVAFVATVFGSGVTSDSSLGIWHVGTASTQLVARTTSQAPGTPPGATFSNLWTIALNSQGQMAFWGGLSGTGVDGFNQTGLWGGPPSSPQLIARQGDSAPGTDLQYGSFYYQDPIALNDQGEIGFEAGLVAPPDANKGIWSGPPDALTLLARDNDPAPETSMNYRSVNAPTLNAHGEAAWGAQLPNPWHGLFTNAGGTPRAIAIGGTQAPGAPSGVNYGNLRKVHLNDNGKVAFTGDLSGPGVMQYVNETALWAGEAGDIHLIVRAGDVAPGGAGGVFRTFDYPYAFLGFNNDGIITFKSQLSNGKRGLWYADPDGIISPIAIEGDLFDIGGGVFRTLVDLTFAPWDASSERRPLGSPLNESGLLAFRATFTDGSSGIFVAAIPEPSGLALTLAAFSLSLRRARRD